MRICFVHEEYPEETNFGGIATYQKNMAINLTKLGHKVIVVCRGLYKDRHYVEDGVEIYRIYQRKTDNQIKDYVCYRNRVAKLLKKLQSKSLIDIIEVPDWGAETVKFEKFRKVPLVLRLHTPLKVWLQYNQNNFGNVTEKMLNWEEEMIKKADCVTCCSNILKDICTETFNLNPQKILVTPNPADLSNFYLDKSVKKEDRIVFVGSLEERKGVIVLAKALNIFLRKYPDVCVDFIGKDTNRNYKNISTIKLVKSIINKDYKNRINFIGQIENYKINYYLNRAKVAVFPSMFDNFPYVVLESMATGVHVIGSKNSGMVEMLNDNNSIYETGNEFDLAHIIEKKFKQKSLINKHNLNRVNKFYRPEIIVKNMIKIYNDLIIANRSDSISNEEANIVLKKCLKKDEQIRRLKKAKSGVANVVYFAYTEKKTFVIKKYLYNYNFDFSKKLYTIYKNNGISVCEPINDFPIKYNGFEYNVFEFIKCKHLSKSKRELIFIKLLKTNRKINDENYVQKKCDFYYNELKKIIAPERIRNDINELIHIYEKIRNSINDSESFLNHGDITKQNIIYDTIIDFDECSSTYELYDYAVIIVKNYSKKRVLDDKFIEKFVRDTGVRKSKDDLNIMICFYLSKILLEKFYLHSLLKIDLFSRKQKKDYYKKYFAVLKKLVSKI